MDIGTHSQTRRYTFYGVIFGCCFPVGATLLDLLFIRDMSVSIDTLLQIQATQPLHWIIDSAPFVLGVFASFAGRHQDRVIGISRAFEAENHRASELANVKPSTRMMKSDIVCFRSCGFIIVRP